MKKSNRHFCIVILFLSLCSITGLSQEYKFDFGSGKAVQGYTKVTPADGYDATKGFGFENGSQTNAVRTKNGKGVYGDFITAAKPFYFSVKIPEGNYDVKIFLGDADGVSATTVRAENRRLFVQNLVTKQKEVKEITFTIHIRDSVIRNTTGLPVAKVKLKPRETVYAHWDNRLTLEFNGPMIKVCGVEIIPNKKAATVFLAGNSTVVDQDKEPWAAWGQMFPSFFDAGNIAVANYAESGETMRAFKGEKRLDKIWSLSKPGDYLFIEFAHNDQKPGSSHLDPFTTYQSAIKEWIAEARKRSMIPVLVTSMHRRNFDSSGKIINTLSDYPEAMRQTAMEEKITLVDLNAMSKILYEAWGPEKSLKAFVHFPANTFPKQDSALKDNTHFSTYGAYELARCVVQALKQTALPMVKHLRRDITDFDPAKPGEWEKWYWPLSGNPVISKPDGN